MQATDADTLHYRLRPVATEDNTMADYTLTYDIQDGTGDVPTGGEFGEGTTVTLDDGEGLTKEGFTFGGWSETVGGDAVGTPYEMPAGDTTLYAVWVAEEASGFTLKYNVQGGDGTVGTETYEEGATVTLNDGAGLTKGGFAFGGWSETAGGDAITGTFTMPGSDTILYAVWTPMEMEDFIAECDKIIGVCRDLIDGADYEKGFPAKVVLRETAQDKIMGIRGGAPVKIRNVGFDF